MNVRVERNFVCVKGYMNSSTPGVQYTCRRLAAAADDVIISSARLTQLLRLYLACLAGVKDRVHCRVARVANPYLCASVRTHHSGIWYNLYPSGVAEFGQWVVFFCCFCCMQEIMHFMV